MGKRTGIRKIVDRAAERFGYVTEAKAKANIRLAKRHQEYSDHEYDRGISLPVGTETLVDVYKNSAWVYCCVFAISSHIAAVPIKFYETQHNRKRVDLPFDHWLYALFAKPNSDTSWYDMAEGTMTYLELNGNGYWEIEENRAKRLANMYLLRSDKMRPVPDPKNRVKGYMYDINLKQPIAFTDEQVMQMRYFNPKSELLGLAPMEAAAAALTTDFWAVANMKDVFKNASRVEGVLQAKGTLTDAAYKRIRETWEQAHKGVGKSHRMAILEGGLEFKQASMTPKDMEFVMQRKFSREEIFAVYGVLPVIVGLMEDTSWANAKEQRKEFWQGTLLPKMNKMESAVNVGLLAKYAPGVKMEFDVSGVQALTEDLEKQSTRLSSLVTHGIMKINEARRIMGYPEVDWGETWWTPANLVPYDVEKSIQQGMEELEQEIEEKTQTEPEVETEEEEKEIGDTGDDGIEGLEYSPGSELPVLSSYWQKRLKAAKRR